MSYEMKALLKAKPEAGLRMEYVPVPEPGPDEVLIKVKKSAICGTDVHIWNGMNGRPAPYRCQWLWGMNSAVRPWIAARQPPSSGLDNGSRGKVTWFVVSAAIVGRAGGICAAIHWRSA